MAPETANDSGSASDKPGNGGKKYLQDEPGLKESIVGLKKQSNGHEKRLKKVETEVIEINSKVSVLDEIKDLSKQTNETVIRMDEKQGNFLTKENYLQDKIKEVKEVSGVHTLPPEFPTASAEIRIEKGGFQEFLSKNIKLILLILALLGAAGVHPTVTWAIGDKEEEVQPNQIEKLLEQQQEFIKNVNKLMQDKGVKSESAIATEEDDPHNSGG